jgi:3-hydroxyisobutyrate dehydrogenase
MDTLSRKDADMSTSVSESASQTIAFIGLGNMGAGMAANLAKAGHRVQAYDVSRPARDVAAAAGCTVAAGAAEAMAGAQVAITMLPNGALVGEVWREALIPNAAPGTLLIDCSTIDVATARAVVEDARAVGLRGADAPVSGGTAAANAGTLAFMVGCGEADFVAVEAVLQPMARAVIRAGEPGAGQAAKICNNMLLAISMIGTCEAFALAERLGLDPQAFFDIASKSSGQCWSLTSYCPWPGPVPAAPSNRNYEGGFASALMLKDLRLSQDAAKASGAKTPLGAHAAALYEALVAEGAGARDFSVMLERLRAGVSS